MYKKIQVTGKEYCFYVRTVQCMCKLKNLCIYVLLKFIAID